MFYLTACLIFKDAAPYLWEWIEFHKQVGVEHFYLYDNDSADDYEAVIDPYLRQGDITLYKWPGLGAARSSHPALPGAASRNGTLDCFY